MVLRGSSSVRNAKKKSESRSSRGGGRKTMLLGLDWRLKPGESRETVGYFTGMFEEEIDISDYVEEDDEGKLVVDLPDDDDDLYEMAEEIGARIWVTKNDKGEEEPMKLEHLKQSITNRLTKEMDPIIWVRHYTDRNKTIKGKNTYSNCGDPEAAVNAADPYNFTTKCRPCGERQGGDKSVGNPMQRICWAFYDMRKQHVVKAEKKGDYDERYDCTLEEKNRCTFCSRNRKAAGGKDQEDLSKEELKNLVENYGYSPKYTVASRILDLPMGQAGAVDIVATKVRMTMCRCGDGELTVDGGECPECNSEFDFDDLVSNGWNPEEPDPDKQLKFRCGECDEAVKPRATFECSECDDPTSARLGDVPIRVTVLKGEKGSTWSFAPDGPACPIELGDDPDTDRVLGCRMPDWDQHTRVPEVLEQLDYLSLQVDPLGEVEVPTGGGAASGPVVAAPTVGRSGGKKPPKGKKPKGKKSGFFDRD